MTVRLSSYSSGIAHYIEGNWSSSELQHKYDDQVFDGLLDAMTATDDVD